MNSDQHLYSYKSLYYVNIEDVTKYDDKHVFEIVNPDAIHELLDNNHDAFPLNRKEYLELMPFIKTLNYGKNELDYSVELNKTVLLNIITRKIYAYLPHLCNDIINCDCIYTCKTRFHFYLPMTREEFNEIKEIRYSRTKNARKIGTSHCGIERQDAR